MCSVFRVPTTVHMARPFFLGTHAVLPCDAAKRQGSCDAHSVRRALSAGCNPCRCRCVGSDLRAGCPLVLNTVLGTTVLLTLFNHVG
jgi:hypothetical protein